ncbi:hypothetical protein [Aeromonas allosaccharophila]
MIPETRFEQAHGVTASKLSYAVTLMDKGDLEAARDVILDVQKTNEEQARVIDARVYGAVRHICESRKIDSRRFFAMQQVLGLREFIRSLMMAPVGMDMISMHLSIENDFFGALLSQVPQSPELTPLSCDNVRAVQGTYHNGNARLWTLFCEEQKGLGNEGGQA